MSRPAYSRPAGPFMPAGHALRNHPERRSPAAGFHQPGAGQGRRDLSLLGLEHPVVRRLMEERRGLGAADRSLIGRLSNGVDTKGVVSVWRVETRSGQGRVQQRILPLGLNCDGERFRPLERLLDRLGDLQPWDQSVLSQPAALNWSVWGCRDDPPGAGAHGRLAEDTSFSARLLAWLEMA